MKAKNSEKKLGKKVLKHIKADDKDFREQIQDDKKLAKTIKKTIKTKGK